jgi:hypothetical protein
MVIKLLYLVKSSQAAGDTPLWAVRDGGDKSLQPLLDLLRATSMR